jgi:glycosyltransferase involved in cell wall biosynthesis
VNQFPFFKRDYSQEPTFLFASKLLISKGVEEYLKAAKNIIKKNLNAKFLIAGKYDPTQHDPISVNSYQKLLNEEKITYLGELSYRQMNEAFRKSTIFVLPSYGEGLPKVLLEAAATGLPLITTDVPGCRDCIKNETNGKLISPRNISELTDAMESFIFTKESKMLEYSRSSELIVHSRYSLDVITKKYISLIN